MEVLLLEIASQKLINAELMPAKISDMKGITDGWDFSWKKHFNLPNSKAFKIVLKSAPGIVQGLLLFQMLGKEEPYMAFLESAPHNKGKDKQFDFVAGCLISMACQLSFLEGKGHYEGFLSFQCMDEKVIKVYAEKYGAIRADRTFMFIEPSVGKQLIEEYLFRKHIN
jgi:hypothetical protein